jgi:hypothetical protein
MKYTRDMLKKIGMDKAKSIKMHMGTNGHLDLDLGDTSIDQNVYRFMIGSLLYLCTPKPDIMLNVYVCKIPNRTQRLSFKGGQENYAVSTSHT